MATKTLLTVEEFLRLQHPKDVWYELVEGELVVVSPGMLRHNRVRDTALIVFRGFVEGRKLGTVVAEQCFHLFGNTVRIPDLAVILGERDFPRDRPIEGAPDLVVEVVSPVTHHARSTSGSAITSQRAASASGSSILRSEKSTSTGQAA